MNAADFTHALKLAGGNTRMWVGLFFLLLVVAAIAYWWGDPKNRERVCAGLFGQMNQLAAPEESV
jgi:hypothetical protein